MTLFSYLMPMHLNLKELAGHVFLDHNRPSVEPGSDGNAGVIISPSLLNLIGAISPNSSIILI